MSCHGKILIFIHV